MAIYLVFRTVENIHSDPFIDVKRLRIGEVVQILPADHNFSPAELTNPGWRMVLANNLSIDDAASFVAPEVDDDPQNPNPLLMRRQYKLDLQHPAITKAFKDFFTDDTRRTPIYTTNMAKEALLALRVTKPTRRGEIEL